MLLQVEDINTYYGESHVLQGVSLNIKEGETIALLGRNGMGKSTTLKTIMGLVKPQSGTISFRKNDITGYPSYKAARTGIAYVPEERRIFPNLSIKDNLLIGIKSKSHSLSAKMEGWNLERVYKHFPVLKDRHAMKGSHLSGGEQQMLAIARSLMGNPDLLLVDEPTEGLAPIMVQEVCHILKEIADAGMSILLVEHNLKVAMSLADRVCLMGKACIGYEGSIEDLENHPEIREKYLEV